MTTSSTFFLLQLVLCIVCCGFAAARKLNAEDNEERRVIIEAAIANVKEEFVQKDAAKANLDTAQEKLHSFKMASKEALAQGYARLKFEKMVKRAESKILEKQRQATVQTTGERVESLAMEFLHTPGTLLTKQELAKIYQESDCHKTVPTPADCSAFMSMRSADGICNNLQNPTQGAANTPMRRLIPPRYDDGISRLQGTLQIRRVSIVPGPFSPPNPSPRVVSLGVVSDRPNNDTQFSHILMQWGQFMDHDLDAIPEFEMCPSGCEVEEDSCVPFPVPEDDSDVSRISGGDSQFCHGFRRSLPACQPEGTGSVQPREQINGITHFIDGSMVYHHNSSVQMNLIRNQSSPDGLLNVGPAVPGSSRPSLPILDTRANPGIVACPTRNTGPWGRRGSNPCFLAGDFRVNEQTALTVMHTVWLREHNRIASTLRRNNAQLSSDQVFQTTRNIVIAMIQKITYKDYLPIILGDRFPDLVPAYSGYKSDVNPNIPNAFATAAYRFGHSQIQPFFERLDKNYKSIPAGPLSLVDAFFDTTQFTRNGGTDPMLRGLLTRNARQVDEFLNSILTSRLFSSGASVPGLDLAALNIQRGRDHGLPRYLTWKQWAKERCEVESEFRNQLTQIHLLQTYGSLNNVDLFVGGLAEEPLPGGIVGAVFACIFANTFAPVRDGDRFYYENPAGSMPLFTSAQRAEIEKASLSRIVCDNSDLSEVQPNAFMANQNRVPCSQLPSVDLSRWSSSGGITLPDICYLKFSSGNGRRARYTAVSQRDNAPSVRISRRRLSSRMTDCLSFNCPTSASQTMLTVSSSNGCPVQVNMNLQSSSQTNYTEKLSAGDIKTTSGLYTSLGSCRAGRDVALTFCAMMRRGPDVEEEADQQLDDDMDKNVGEDELRQLLPGFSLDQFLGGGGGGGGKEETSEKKSNEALIALMEEVLTSLKGQSSTAAWDETPGSDKTSNIMELDEALKQLH